MVVHTIAYLGFTASGSSNASHRRHIITVISPTYTKQIFELREAEAAEAELHPLLAQAVTGSYFADWAPATRA
ncbi:hypothetical protein [Streptomyces sp. bgisy095]|uniref:hypothetical protein n=1 Tax=unclassified Streptomyces TaxID=2593676 RepID=UPI003D731FEA